MCVPLVGSWLSMPGFAGVAVGGTSEDGPQREWGRLHVPPGTDPPQTSGRLVVARFYSGWVFFYWSWLVFVRACVRPCALLKPCRHVSLRLRVVLLGVCFLNLEADFWVWYLLCSPSSFCGGRFRCVLGGIFYAQMQGTGVFRPLPPPGEMGRVVVVHWPAWQATWHPLWRLPVCLAPCMIPRHYKCQGTRLWLVLSVIWYLLACCKS